MIEVVAGLEGAFTKAQESYGGDKIDVDTRISWAARGVSEMLRQALCRMMSIPEDRWPEVMARPYQHGPLPAATQSSRSVDSARGKAGQTGYQLVSLPDEGIYSAAQRLLDVWGQIEPQRRGRKPLRVFNGRDNDLSGWLLPWFRAASPGVRINSTSQDQLSQVMRWWDNVVFCAYESPKLNGSTPGRLGVSLEWLAGAEVGADGRRHPLLRLHRLIEGYYDRDQRRAG